MFRVRRSSAICSNSPGSRYSRSPNGLPGTLSRQTPPAWVSLAGPDPAAAPVPHEPSGRAACPPPKRPAPLAEVVRLAIAAPDRRLVERPGLVDPGAADEQAVPGPARQLDPPPGIEPGEPPV